MIWRGEDNEECEVQFSILECLQISEAFEKLHTIKNILVSREITYIEINKLYPQSLGNISYLSQLEQEKNTVK